MYLKAAARQVLLLSATMACAALLPGCGSSTPDVVIPAESPAEAGKDSMDYYKNNVMKKGAAKRPGAG
jgi:hypothetical protein